jgi:hypothetical protein
MRRVSLAMRASVGLLTALLIAPSPGSAEVPLVSRGQSGDPWEAFRGGSEDYCLRPDDAYFAIVPSQNEVEAVARLAHAPAVELSDGEAARLLELSVQQNGTAAAAFLAVSRSNLEAARQDVYQRRVGSWSGSDQEELDRLKAIADGPRLAAFRPYLLRSLGPGMPEDEPRLDVIVCYGGVAVLQTATGSLERPPVRGAVVVFLEQAPKAVFVEWWVGEP